MKKSIGTVMYSKIAGYLPIDHLYLTISENKWLGQRWGNLEMARSLLG